MSLTAKFGVVASVWWRYNVALPARRVWAYRRERQAGNQLCKRCGRAQNEVDFVVSDQTWETVVPRRWRSWALCLVCFERFAADRGTQTVRVFLVECP